MIVITGPTGTIGKQVLENVLKSGEPVRVIARDSSRLPSRIRKSVEVVHGVARRHRRCEPGVRGRRRRVLLVPPDPHAKSVEAAYVNFTRPTCDAIKNLGSGGWSESRPSAVGRR